MPKSSMKLDKFNKTALAGGILLIGASLFYYLVIYTPGLQSAKEQAQLTKEQSQLENKAIEDKQRCRDVGVKVYNQHKSKYEDRGYFVEDSNYAFNKGLNSCLISLYWAKDDISGRYILRREVQDSLTGQMIITFERADLEVVFCGDLRTDPPKKCNSEGTYVGWEQALMKE